MALNGVLAPMKPSTGVINSLPLCHQWGVSHERQIHTQTHSWSAIVVRKVARNHLERKEGRQKEVTTRTVVEINSPPNVMHCVFAAYVKSGARERCGGGISAGMCDCVIVCQGKSVCIYVNIYVRMRNIQCHFTFSTRIFIPFYSVAQNEIPMRVVRNQPLLGFCNICALLHYCANWRQEHVFACDTRMMGNRVSRRSMCPQRSYNTSFYILLQIS